MGQTLSEPNTNKETAFLQNNVLAVGSSCMQGWRTSMEDAHTAILSLPQDSETAYFGVFDGHGGQTVAKFSGSNLHKFILKRSEYEDDDLVTAIQKGYIDFDRYMMNDSIIKNDLSGSTAICIFLKTDGSLYCGNVGDSRAVACVNHKALALSTDHKPSLQDEKNRIRAAGGFVEFNRVNGNLALSRALGDFNFKRNFRKPSEEQIISAFPDVLKMTINENWKFIIMACDGVWDVISNEEAVNFIETRLDNKMRADTVCEELIMRCLAPDVRMGGIGCDNMTAVLIVFKNNLDFVCNENTND